MDETASVDSSFTIDSSVRSLDSFLPRGDRGEQQELELEFPHDQWPTPHTALDSRGKDHDEDDEEIHSASPSAYVTIFGCLCCGMSFLNQFFVQFSVSAGKEPRQRLSISMPSVILGSKLQSISRLLNSEMAHELYSMLPETTKLSLPVLLFSTYKDGWSMENLLEKTRGYDPVIILVRALRSKVLVGAYCTAQISPPSLRVRGTGETFVFRLTSPHAMYRWSYIPSMKKETRNQYVVSCREYIAIGASATHGTNALRLDGDLRSCSCGPSDTFQNPSLVPEEDCFASIEENTPIESHAELRSVGIPFPVEDIEIIHLPSAGSSQMRRGLR